MEMLEFNKRLKDSNKEKKEGGRLSQGSRLRRQESVWEPSGEMSHLEPHVRLSSSECTWTHEVQFVIASQEALR